MSYVAYQQVDPNSDHQLKPGRELGNDLRDERGNGVSIIGFMKLCLVQPIYQNDVVILWNFPLCKHKTNREVRLILAATKTSTGENSERSFEL